MMLKDVSKIKLKKGFFVCKPKCGKDSVQFRKHEWSWSFEQQVFYTNSSSQCWPLRRLTVGKARKKIEEWGVFRRESIAPSLKLDSDLEVPAPEGKTYLPFQKAGIEFMIARPNTLVADPPGLGKTIETIGYINYLKLDHIVIVCPASLRDNWEKELRAWLVEDLTIGQVCSKVSEGVRQYYFPDTDIVILNYEMVPVYKEQLYEHCYDLLVIDEGHRLQNSEAQRTRYIYGHAGKWVNQPNRKDHWPVLEGIEADHILPLTGSPLTSRPINLWPHLKRLDPNGLGKSYEAYTERYCGAYYDKRLHKNDVSGSTNQAELQDLLRSRIMLRRTKESALPQLPSKQQRIIEIQPSKEIRDLIDSEYMALRDLLAEYENNEQSELIHPFIREIDGGTIEEQTKKLTTSQEYSFEEYSELRKAIAIAKAPLVVKYVQDLIDQGEKVVLFCYHKDVAKFFREAFTNCAFITGDVPNKNRQGEVDKFQTDKSCMVFVGNITAAGEGHTLTASSTVVFAEITWVPSELEQAEDRIWRIGQDNACQIDYLLWANSLDAVMMKKVITKKINIDSTLEATDVFLGYDI